MKTTNFLLVQIVNTYSSTTNMPLEADTHLAIKKNFSP